MKHISVDREQSVVKEFVRSLSGDKDDSILELNGQPVLQVHPITAQPVDRDLLKQAILKRRDESRRLNSDWAAVDAEAWDNLPGAKG